MRLRLRRTLVNVSETLEALVGRRVRQDREAAGVTLAELAKRCAVPQGTLELLEEGVGGFGLDLMLAIASSLDVPAHGFFDADRGDALRFATRRDGSHDPVVVWALDLIADMRFAEQALSAG